MADVVGVAVFGDDQPLEQRKSTTTGAARFQLLV